MKKKDLLQKIETLHIQLENSRKSKTDLENKIFDEKMKLVYETLKSLGDLNYEVIYDRAMGQPEIICEKTYIFTLNTI